MDRARWTYEIPAAAADAVGLEDYEVESAKGEPVGKVKVVLRRDDDLFLAVEGRRTAGPARAARRSVGRNRRYRP
jgi:hypothetical protein